MELWELEARIELTELVHRYNVFGDSGRFAEMVALFAPDGVLEVAAGEVYHGRVEIEAFMTGIGESVTGGATPGYIRHHNTTKTFDVTGPNDATGSSYFFVLTGRGPDHWGRYRDTFTRDRNGRWHFAYRKVRTDGRSPGSWAEEWNR